MFYCGFLGFQVRLCTQLLNSKIKGVVPGAYQGLGNNRARTKYI